MMFSLTNYVNWGYLVTAILAFVGSILSFLSKPIRDKDGRIPADFYLYQMAGSATLLFSLILVVAFWNASSSSADSDAKQAWTWFATTMLMLVLLSSLSSVVYIARMGSSFSTQDDHNTKGAVGVISTTFAMAVITLILQMYSILKPQETMASRLYRRL